MQLIEIPQSPRSPRRDGWTPARREQFLEHLVTGLDVKRACALVGLSRQKAYTLRGRDAAFAAAWHEARRAARANREAACLALLPEKLRRTLSCQRRVTFSLPIRTSGQCQMCQPRVTLPAPQTARGMAGAEGGERTIQAST